VPGAHTGARVPERQKEPSGGCSKRKNGERGTHVVDHTAGGTRSLRKTQRDRRMLVEGRKNETEELAGGLS